LYFLLKIFTCCIILSLSINFSRALLQETPESQLQAARAVINEYHQPQKAPNSRQRQQQKSLPLKMTVSRTAKRKLDFPAVQHNRRNFLSQCDSREIADLPFSPYSFSQFSQRSEYVYHAVF
jgi:hypothetical protein